TPSGFRTSSGRACRWTRTASAPRSFAARTTSPPTSCSRTDCRPQRSDAPSVRTPAWSRCFSSVAPRPMETGVQVIFDFLSYLKGVAFEWLPLIFLGLLVYLFWRMLAFMPRVKPTEVDPDSKAAIGWEDIAGVDEAAAELQEVVDFLQHPRRFAQLGARVPKGILLYGPPGTGKTLLAKAVAHASGATFYSQSASAFVEMFAGLGAARIRKLFKDARKHAPAIIFIDELDAVGAAPTGHGFNREQDQTLNQLLVELDGFGTSARVVVLGA